MFGGSGRMRCGLGNESFVCLRHLDPLISEEVKLMLQCLPFQSPSQCLSHRGLFYLELKEWVVHLLLPDLIQILIKFVCFN